MANNNKYTAETPITLDNKEYTLLFTWRQFAEVKTVFKEKEFSAILNGFDTSELAKLLVIGLKTKHQDITEDFILDLNPPPAIGDVISALDEALNRAITGGKSFLEDDSQSSPQQEEQTAT